MSALPVIVFLAAIYFLIVRPRRNRKKKIAKMSPDEKVAARRKRYIDDLFF